MSTPEDLAEPMALGLQHLQQLPDPRGQRFQFVTS
jgi:hypothetical protein